MKQSAFVRRFRGKTIAHGAQVVREHYPIWGSRGGRMQGYLPTLYLPQIFTKLHRINCVGREIKGGIDPAPCAGGAGIFPNIVQEGWDAGVPTLPVAPSFPHGFW